ncbi:hypothetical protein BC940DRAFT_312346 [Gongronella butleri]|nr:hypothetical protein BC940DRAFT_312346 [Gongronella butleri]
MNIDGFGLVCFLPPFDDHGSAVRFQGHLLDMASRRTVGMAGELMVDYEDPNHSDCMDPVAFYKVTATIYAGSTDQKAQPVQNSGDEQLSFVLRREIHNDMATLATDPEDDGLVDQPNSTVVRFELSPTRVHVDQDAYNLCKKYLPRLAAMDDDAEGLNWTMCFGDASLRVSPAESA